MSWPSPIEQLRRYLISGLGLVSPLLLAGCGGAVTSEGEGNVTTDPSGDGSMLEDEGTTDPPTPSTTGPMPGTTGPDPDDTDDTDDTDTDDTDDTGTDDTGEPIKLDLPAPDLPPLGGCTTTLADSSALDDHPDCPIVLEDGGCWSNLYWGCVEPEPGQTCEQLCPDGDCIADWWNCAGDPVFEPPWAICGPYEIDGMCCTLADIVEGCGTDGRPFVIDGVSRQAALRVLDHRSARARLDLPERVREHLASRFAASARAEHASIASFAHFAARLLALGAPASLVADALAAAADEVRHAQCTLAVAARLGAQALEFGPLDTRGASTSEQSLADTLLACVREGCIGETLAALELHAAARGCEDLELAASLRAIADDEARHALLAWRFMQWGLAREPEFGPKLAALCDSLASSLESGASASVSAEPFDAHERALLRAHGCLPADERRQLERDGLHELVLPCARALLATVIAAPLRDPSDGELRLARAVHRGDTFTIE